MAKNSDMTEPSSGKADVAKSNFTSPSYTAARNSSLQKNAGGLPPKKTREQVAKDSFPKKGTKNAGF